MNLTLNPIYIYIYIYIYIHIHICICVSIHSSIHPSIHIYIYRHAPPVFPQGSLQSHDDSWWFRVTPPLTRCIYVYIYIYVYMYMYTYTYTHTHTHIYIYIYIHTYIYISIHPSFYIHVCRHAPPGISSGFAASSRRQLVVDIYVYIHPSIHLPIHIHIYTDTPPPPRRPRSPLRYSWARSKLMTTAGGHVSTTTPST